MRAFYGGQNIKDRKSCGVHQQRALYIDKWEILVMKGGKKF